MTINMKFNTVFDCPLSHISSRPGGSICICKHNLICTVRFNMLFKSCGLGSPNQNVRFFITAKLSLGNSRTVDPVPTSYSNLVGYLVCLLS